MQLLRIGELALNRLPEAQWQNLCRLFQCRVHRIASPFFWDNLCHRKKKKNRRPPVPLSAYYWDN
jgi:hypothetical protein